VAEPYYADESVTLYLGDCLGVLPDLPDCSVDAIVTDPPYGLEFMGKDWAAPWQAGEGIGEHNAGFHEITLADGAKRLPRAVFMGSTNPTCRNCGGTRQGNDRQSRRRCRCDRPEFPNVTLPRMVAFQAWCQSWAAECLRVLKPGGYLLAFGGPRAYHRLACAVEDAGFEVRDSIGWLFGSGHPMGPAWLKPAHEPVVVARKAARQSDPLPGLASCRVGGDDSRWPPNILLGHSAACDGKCSPDCPVAELGRQGGAVHIFPAFRYEAKAAARERPRLEDGTAHNTVKPVDLMAWLVRLVTPPGGLVLDLFAGSGTTAEACIVEGFRCVLIEKDPKSAALIRKRLSKAIQPVMFGLEA
jgi:DNA modification methylase